MDIFTLSLWVITLIFLFISLKKDKKKTIDSLKNGKSMMSSMIGSILGILFLLGVLLTFLPPEMIRTYMGGSNIFTSTVLSALLGSVTLIPAFVAFPLVGSFVDAGASIVPAVAFLTTLTMVGFVTFPLEKKEFGLKFAALRNSLSFVLAIVIALTMGLIM